MPLVAFARESIVKANAYISPGSPKGVMPQTFATQLSKKQLADLVAFITGTKKSALTRSAGGCLDRTCDRDLALASTNDSRPHQTPSAARQGASRFRSRRRGNNRPVRLASSKRADDGEKAALLRPVAPLGAKGASGTRLLRVSRLRQIPRSHPDRTADLLVLRLSVLASRNAKPSWSQVSSSRER